MQEKIFHIEDNSQFEALALEIFDYQIQHNNIYAEYAKLILKGKKPKNIYEIPFLPISFFKTHQIICKWRKIEQIFHSSGTTGEKSRHFVSDIDLYKQSFLTSFNQFYGNIKDYCILSLLPNYRAQKNSSLVYMVNELISMSENGDSGFYLDNYKEVASILKKLERKKQKTILFGVSYAILDLAIQFPQKLKSTIIIETGGMKGRRKELLKEELHMKIQSAFKLQNVHSEYGMTELLSQSYSFQNGIFKCPAWKKVLIRDIHDPLSIIDNNKTGGINIIDLANIFSCSFIATDDLGEKYDDDTFSILGRISNSDLRGCNLMI